MKVGSFFTWKILLVSLSCCLFITSSSSGMFGEEHVEKRAEEEATRRQAYQRQRDITSLGDQDDNSRAAARENLSVNGPLERAPVEVEGDLLLHSQELWDTGSIFSGTAPTETSSLMALRGFLQLNSEQFEKIAGKPRTLSMQYRYLVSNLKKYNDLKGRSVKQSQKQALLLELEQQASNYLKREEQSLKIQLLSEVPDCDRIKQLYQRIDACHLLQQGIIVEKFALARGFFSQDVHFRPEKISSYQDNFASGNTSSLSLVTYRNHRSRVFKPDYADREIMYKPALSMGIPSEFSNFSGRSVATYRIARLLELDLVPVTDFAFVGGVKCGHCQLRVPGEQLLREVKKKISPEEFQECLEKQGITSDIYDYQKYVLGAALGENNDNNPHEFAFNYWDINDWQISFPPSLIQTSRERSLKENGMPIGRRRALNLFENGELFFVQKKYAGVNKSIDFRYPLLQEAMANVHLLHLITGELDPNPGNFIYPELSQASLQAGTLTQQQPLYIIDSDYSFPEKFTEINSEKLRALWLRQPPTLIDRKMAVKILKLRPENIERALERTGLRTEEVNATKSRLLSLQKYIQDEIGETNWIKEWNAATYDQSVAPFRDNNPLNCNSYLGYMVYTQRKVQEEIDQLSNEAKEELLAIDDDDHNLSLENETPSFIRAEEDPKYEDWDYIDNKTAHQSPLPLTETEHLRVITNKFYTLAKDAEQAAKKNFEDAQQNVASFTASLQERDHPASVWERTLTTLFLEGGLWSEVVENLEEEKKSAPSTFSKHRNALLKTAKEKQALAATHQVAVCDEILRIYQTPKQATSHASSLAWDQQIEDIKYYDNYNFYLAQAQKEKYFAEINLEKAFTALTKTIVDKKQIEDFYKEAALRYLNEEFALRKLVGICRTATKQMASKRLKSQWNEQLKEACHQHNKAELNRYWLEIINGSYGEYTLRFDYTTIEGAVTHFTVKPMDVVVDMYAKIRNQDPQYLNHWAEKNFTKKNREAVLLFIQTQITRQARLLANFFVSFYTKTPIEFSSREKEISYKTKKIATLVNSFTQARDAFNSFIETSQQWSQWSDVIPEETKSEWNSKLETAKKRKKNLCEDFLNLGGVNCNGVLGMISKEIEQVFFTYFIGISFQEATHQLTFFEEQSFLRQCLEITLDAMVEADSPMSWEYYEDHIIRPYFSALIGAVPVSNLTVTQLLNGNNTSFSKDAFIAFKPEKGIHVIPASRLKNQSRLSLRQGYEQFLSMIGDACGQTIKNALRAAVTISSQNAFQKKLTIQEVRNFFNRNLLVKPGVFLPSPEAVKECYLTALHERGPELTQDFSSIQLDLLADQDRRVARDEVDLPNAMLPKAYCHILGRAEREALKNDPHHGCVAIVEKNRPNTDWARLELTINGEIFKPAGRELDEAKFRGQITELTGIPCSEEQSQELIMMMDKNGRVAGFASGSDVTTGLNLGTRNNTHHSRHESVNITFSREENRLKLDYHTGAVYLNGIFIPTPFKHIWINLNQTIDGEDLFAQNEKVLSQLPEVYGAYTYRLIPLKTNLNPGESNPPFRERFDIERSQLAFGKFRDSI